MVPKILFLTLALFLSSVSPIPHLANAQSSAFVPPENKQSLTHLFSVQKISLSLEILGDPDSLWDNFKSLVEDSIHFLGLDPSNKTIFIISTLFYLSLSFFILFWLIEFLLKCFRKVFAREHREMRVKRFARIAFKTTLVGKFILFILTALGLFSQAISMNIFYKNYLKKPENILSLIMNDKVFLIILGITILIFLIRRKLESEGD